MVADYNFTRNSLCTFVANKTSVNFAFIWDKKGNRFFYITPKSAIFGVDCVYERVFLQLKLANLPQNKQVLSRNSISLLFHKEITRLNIWTSVCFLTSLSIIFYLVIFLSIAKRQSQWSYSTRKPQQQWHSLDTTGYASSFEDKKIWESLGNLASVTLNHMILVLKEYKGIFHGLLIEARSLVDFLGQFVYCCKNRIVIRKISYIFRYLVQGYIFSSHILQHFTTKLCNFTNFRMLFNAVVMNYPIAKFFKQSLSCNWSINTSNWFIRVISFYV